MALRQSKYRLRVLMLLFQLEVQARMRLRIRTRPVLAGLLDGHHSAPHWLLRFSLGYK